MKKNKENVGIDIGSYSIKIVSIISSADKPQLNGYNIKNLPVYEEKPYKVGEYIKEALKEMDIKPPEVNLSISGSDVVVRFINFPRMNKEQMENALAFEAERYIPFSVNEVILDFAVLDNAGEGKMNVLLAAAKTDLVNSKIDLLQKVGIGVTLIDINAFSLFNAFLTFNTQIEADKVSAFVDIGHSQANVLISSGQIPRFMRVIQMGGADITNTISGDLNVSLQQAEEMKISSDAEKKEEIIRSSASVLDDLIKELKLSFNYFSSKHGSEIKEVFVSGGVIYQQGILDYLREKLDSDVNTWDPLKGLKFSNSLSRDVVESVAQQLGVSIGLALRS